MIVVYAFVAQQVERTAVNRDVGGSSPPESVREPFFQNYASETRANIGHRFAQLRC